MKTLIALKKKLIAFLLSLFSPHNEGKYLLVVGVLIVAGFGFAGLSLCKKDPAWIALVAPCVALVAVVSSNYQANKRSQIEELLKAENLLKETYEIVVDDLRRAVSPHEWLYVLGVCHVLGDIKNRLDSRNVSYLEQKLRLYADKWLILLNEKKSPELYYGLTDRGSDYVTHPSWDLGKKKDRIRARNALDPEDLGRIHDFFNKYATELPEWKAQLKVLLCTSKVNRYDDYEKIKHPLDLLSLCNSKDEALKCIVKDIILKYSKWVQYVDEYRRLQKEIEEED